MLQHLVRRFLRQNYTFEASSTDLSERAWKHLKLSHQSLKRRWDSWYFDDVALTQIKMKIKMFIGVFTFFEKLHPRLRPALWGVYESTIQKMCKQTLSYRSKASVVRGFHCLSFLKNHTHLKWQQVAKSHCNCRNEMDSVGVRLEARITDL